MPAVFEYNAPISGTVSDNKSYTTKGLLTLKPCTSGVPNGCQGLWNQTLCGADEYYSQPFIRGDKIYEQFHFDKSTYLSMRFFVVDCTTLEETEITGGDTQQCTTDDTREDFQNVVLDTTDLPKCFYIKAKLYDCLYGKPALCTTYVGDDEYVPSPVTVNYSISGTPLAPVALDPSDTAQAQIDFQTALSAAFPGFTAVVTWYSGPQIWAIAVTAPVPGDAYAGISPDVTAVAGGKPQLVTPGTFALIGEGGDCTEAVAEHCTEPYKEVECDENTLVIESTYTKADCFGNFYQDTQNCTTNIFSNKYRIPGELINDGFDFIQTKTAHIDVSVTNRRRYTLLLPKLPKYVAERIAMIFGGQYFSIDGIVYEGNVKLDKDFDFGRSWIIKTTLFRECITDFGCE